MQGQRFMLLGTARTGSNFLSSLLSAHPSIKMYGELFNLDTIPRNSLLEALEDPVAYLRNRLYKVHRPEIIAVGFKMFHDHLREEYFRKMIDLSDASEQLRDKTRAFSSFIDANYEWPTLFEKFQKTWDFLVADRSLRVIHLRRRNMLHTLISLKTAFMTRQFWRVHENDQARTRVHLHPDECRRYFQKLETYAEQADVVFGAHRKIDVLYEDVVETRDEELRRIFAFLGVPDATVSTIMKKQISAPPSELVDNYGQLKDCFRQTRWNVFFD